MELRVTATARDGAGVARAADGRVVFVEGALPGEQVRVDLVETNKRWSRARVVEVLVASPDRVPIMCEAQVDGCGGCDMLHVESRAQVHMKKAIVVDQLARHDLDFPVPELRLLDGDTGRTTVRAAVRGGRAGLRVRGSHEVVVPEACGAVDEGVEELLLDGRYGSAGEVLIRVGARTGDRMVVVDRGADEVDVPADVLVADETQLRSGRRAWIHEEVAGRRWRISARSFFQNRPAGAEALVAEVGEMVEALGPEGAMVDAYAGVGLFAGTVGAGRPVVAVERNRSSVADAKANLADADARGDEVRVVRSAVERWRASPAAVVIADPARVGLGEAGARTLAAADPGLLVLVSCDPSSLAADARRLSDLGFRLERLTVVDLFPLTSHVETVAVFVAA